jgi:hypothetical protein
MLLAISYVITHDPENVKNLYFCCLMAKHLLTSEEMVFVKIKRRLMQINKPGSQAALN